MWQKNSDMDLDQGTGSFRPSCATPPGVVGEFWCDGAGCDVCCYYGSYRYSGGLIGELKEFFEI